jgi:cysteine synthase A
VLKEELDDVLVVAVEPARSRALGGGATQPHAIQGIGAGFVPGVLDRKVIDEVITCEDTDSFTMAQRLAREEGISGGMSSGAAVWGALEIAKRLGKGKRVVSVLPDGWDRYVSVDPPNDALAALAYMI